MFDKLKRFAELKPKLMDLLTALVMIISSRSSGSLTVNFSEGCVGDAFFKKKLV